MFLEPSWDAMNRVGPAFHRQTISSSTGVGLPARLRATRVPRSARLCQVRSAVFETIWLRLVTLEGNNVMPSIDLWDLMGLYARQGIADWHIANYGLRRRATECLGTAIAENETEAFVTIGTIYNVANANRLRFIPMPKRPKHGIERCFFLPIREMKARGEETVAFELFLLVEKKNCLGFVSNPRIRSRPPTILVMCR